MARYKIAWDDTVSRAYDKCFARDADTLCDCSQLCFDTLWLIRRLTTVKIATGEMIATVV